MNLQFSPTANTPSPRLVLKRTICMSGYFQFMILQVPEWFLICK